MMTKEEVDRFARKRPFEPFEVRLVDGHRYRFTEVERFLVGRREIVALDRRGSSFFISIGLISEIGPMTRRPRRRPRSS